MKFLLALSLLSFNAFAGKSFRNPQNQVTFCHVHEGIAYFKNLQWSDLEEKTTFIKLVKKDEIEFHIKLNHLEDGIHFNSGKATKETEWFPTFIGGITISDEMQGGAGARFYFLINPKSQNLEKTLKDSCLSDAKATKVVQLDLVKD